jgi:transcriptional regulator with XRE-family HTH domain
VESHTGTTRGRLEPPSALAELRRGRGLTQMQVARALGATQPGVSALEGRSDLHVSTLRRYVEALGGRLELSAVFADGTVPIGVHDVQSYDVDNALARLIGRKLRERALAGDDAAGELATKFEALTVGRIAALRIEPGRDAGVLYEAVRAMDPPPGRMSAPFARLREALEAELGLR